MLFRRSIDGAFACSRYNAAMSEARYHIPVSVAYNGFDETIFRPTPPDPALRARFAPAGIADMDAATEGARQLLYKACVEIDGGSPEASRWASMCKLVAGDTAMRVTTDAVQVLGGYGYIDEFPVERMMRDAKITQLYEGTQQVHGSWWHEHCSERAAERPGEEKGLVRIVVLVKPVPDPASAGERLGPDGRLDRAAVPAVVNGNDEYALEAALKLVEAGGGEVTLLSMAPAERPRDPAQGTRDGRDPRRPRHRSDAGWLVRACRRPASSPRPCASSNSTSSWPASTPRTAWVAWSCCHRRPSRIAVSVHGGEIEPDEAAGTVRVRRIRPTGYDLLEAPMPAVIACTQALGEPRYPSLKGIMAARAKEITTRSLADLGLDPPRSVAR